MSDGKAGIRFRQIASNPWWLAACLYSLSWVITFAAVRIVWGSKLGLLNPLLLAVDFFIPLFLILGLVFLTRKHPQPFKWFGLIYLILLAIVIFNIVRPQVRLMNYGDVGTLSGMIAHNEIFPRWMLGTGVLGFLINEVSFPFFGPADDILLLKTLSAMIMCIFSSVLFYLYPKRLSLVLTFTSPIWLLLSSGYDEYYPFIAPIFILFLLFLSTNRIGRFSPMLVGLFAAILGTSYAGFLPLTLFLLIAFAMWRGFLKGLLAGLVFLVCSFAFIILFNGVNLGSFFINFHSSLNLTNPINFSGQTVLGTPFFKPAYIFGTENLSRMAINFFWTGSFAYLFLFFAGIVGQKSNWPHQETKKVGFFLGLQLLFQLVYFVLMVPQLGSVQDIDLYFTTYLSLSFTAGWLSDKYTEKLDVTKQKNLQLAVFAFCAGSTAVVSLYLILLGIFALV